MRRAGLEGRRWLIRTEWVTREVQRKTLPLTLRDHLVLSRWAWRSLPKTCEDGHAALLLEAPTQRHICNRTFGFNYRHRLLGVNRTRLGCVHNNRASGGKEEQ